MNLGFFFYRSEKTVAVMHTIGSRYGKGDEDDVRLF